MLALSQQFTIYLILLSLLAALALIVASLLRRRRAAGLALREARHRYGQMFEGAPDAAWELSTTGRILHANARMAAFTGHPAAELTGKLCYTVLQTPHCHTSGCPLRTVASQPAFAETEAAVTCVGGQQATCLMAAHAMWDREGNLVGLIESFRDISSQRAAEARFQALVESTGDAITVLGSDGLMSYANEAFCRLVGRGASEVIGNHPAEFCTAASREVLLEQVQQRPRGEGTYELDLQAQDGSLHTVMVTATPLFDDEGRYAGSFAVMKDIGQQRQTALRLAHLNSVLAAIRKVNQLITRESDPAKLLQQACECLIETRGYGAACVAATARTGKIEKLYAAGNTGGVETWNAEFARELWLELSPRPGGSSHIVTHGPDALCLEPEPGRATMAIRLECAGEQYGLLAVSVPAGLAEDEDERGLFREVAGDLAFALHAIEADAQASRAQEHLHLTQFAIDRASDAVYWIGRDGRILDANAAACKALGYGVDEFRGLYVWDIDPLFAREGWAGHWEETRHERGSTIETVHRTKDGREFPVEVTINYVEFRGQEYHYAFARDISARKWAQQRLRKLNRQYELLVESQLVQTFIIQDGRVVFASNSMHELLGHEPGGLIGLAVTELLAPDVRVSLLRWYRQQEGVGAPLQLETQLRHRQGGRRIVQVWAQEIDDLEGAPALIGHIVDVTEERELRRQLEHSQRLEALGTLAGGVAHEFNNVLQAIVLNASLLQAERPVADAENDKLKTIIERSEYGARLTDQLLTFSRRAPVEHGPLNLNKVIDETQRLLERTVPRQVRIEAVTAPDVWAVQGDAGRLKQVLINLALNARDAMPQGGTLTFQTQNVVLNRPAVKAHQRLHEGPYVLVKVSDTGTGMTPEVQARAFEPFFTTKAVGRGTGLGLSIVHGIIDAHAGYVRLHSQPGHGTTFHIYLPAQPQLVLPEEGLKAEPTRSGGNETILVVDDEAEVVRVANHALSAYGYRVLTAADGQQALDIFGSRHREVDLVLLDLIMPGLTGHETLLRLRELDDTAKVIIASGYMPDNNKEPLPRGANAYLDKPFTLHRLLETVREVLDS